MQSLHARRVIACTRKACLPPSSVPRRLFASKKPSSSITVPKFSSISHLATLLKVSFPELQRTMKNLGFANVSWDYIVDSENAALIAEEMGLKIKENALKGENLYPSPLPADAANLKPRAPIVAIMGHVDHGKTTLLDYFRKSHIVDGEKGGITQHIGAFLTQLGSQPVCFLDTPGHEAFLKLRERGAHLTDFVLLVVAADDRVMPQTKEAIKHAKSAGVPMVVAITKCDKEGANFDKVVGELASAGVDVEPYGGDTQCVEVSAKTGKGMAELVSSIQAQSEIQDIRAPQTGFKTEGVIVESSLMKGLGVTASLIVKKGTLKPRQYLVAGTSWCRVRQIVNEHGKQLKEAFPGVPVRVSGWRGTIPEPGEVVLEAENEHQIKNVLDTRERERVAEKELKEVDLINEIRTQQSKESERLQALAERKMLGLQTDEKTDKNDSETKTKKLEKKTLWFGIKADTVGSAEAISDIIGQLGNDEVESRTLFSAVGEITESDIFKAENAKSSIIAFSTPVSKSIERLASKHNVQILKHDVIYRVIQEISGLLSKELAPLVTRKVTGSAEIRQIFNIDLKKKQKLKIAGVRVVSGSFESNTLCQILRNGKVIHRGQVRRIQHAKEQVDKAHKGSEYGFTLDDWTGFEEGDVIEGYDEIVTPRYI